MNLSKQENPPDCSNEQNDCSTEQASKATVKSGFDSSKNEQRIKKHVTFCLHDEKIATDTSNGDQVVHDMLKTFLQQNHLMGELPTESECARLLRNPFSGNPQEIRDHNQNDDPEQPKYSTNKKLTWTHPDGTVMQYQLKPTWVKVDKVNTTKAPKTDKVLNDRAQSGFKLACNNYWQPLAHSTDLEKEQAQSTDLDPELTLDGLSDAVEGPVPSDIRSTKNGDEMHPKAYLTDVKNGADQIVVDDTCSIASSEGGEDTLDQTSNSQLNSNNTSTQPVTVLKLKPHKNKSLRIKVEFQKGGQKQMVTALVDSGAQVNIVRKGLIHSKIVQTRYTY